MVLLLFVVARMEKEMEGMMEELVAEMVVEMKGGRPKEGTASLGCWRWLAIGEERRQKNERERRSGGVYIKGRNYYYKYAIVSKQKRRNQMSLASHLKKSPRLFKMKTCVWQLSRRGDGAFIQGKTRMLRLTEKTKVMMT